MTDIAAAAADYLAIRRAVGFKLASADPWLNDFAAYAAEHSGAVTVALVLQWAGERANTPGGAARRYSVVRLFASYLQALDPETEVPPIGLLTWRSRRRVPYVYSEEEVEALMNAARQLPRPLFAAATETIIGLLAVTGMRIGEVLALDRGDIDWDDSIVYVRLAKFNRARLVPLSPSTLEALGRYDHERRRRCPDVHGRAFFIGDEGRRIPYERFSLAFQGVKASAGLPETARIHDFRHRFATVTLLDWYRAGLDVQALLPRLSTYMGHVAPKSTYWYLSGVPELMSLVADRLEELEAGR